MCTCLCVIRILCNKLSSALLVKKDIRESFIQRSIATLCLQIFFCLNMLVS